MTHFIDLLHNPYIFTVSTQLFDCDFNQQLGYTIGATDSTLFEGGKTVFDISNLGELSCDSIKNDNHCFGCTAGMGSS